MDGYYVIFGLIKGEKQSSRKGEIGQPWNVQVIFIKLFLLSLYAKKM